jgi:hypothetical protein
MNSEKKLYDVNDVLGTFSKKRLDGYTVQQLLGKKLPVQKADEKALVYSEFCVSTGSEHDDFYFNMFIDSVFQFIYEDNKKIAADVKLQMEWKHRPYTPSEFFALNGNKKINFDDYQRELEKHGFDVQYLHTLTKKSIDGYAKHRKNNASKAKIFFDLIQTEFLLTQEQIHEYVDEFSIYEILELAINHIAITKARLAAHKSHKEDAASKKDVFDWLDKNFNKSKSMDDFALELAGRLVPHKFRAVRNWITERKKLRSASKP